MNNDIIRENVAKAVRKCSELKAKTIAFDFDIDECFGMPVVLGTSIANYHFDKYKSKKTTEYLKFICQEFLQIQLRAAKVVADSMKLARNLANEPAALQHLQNLLKLLKV